MKPLRTLTARAAAWKALNQCDIFKHDTAEVLGRLLSHTDRPAQATDIVFGVIRNQGTIDHILKKSSAIDSARVKPSQWNLLRIGVYELVYAPKTAEYAVINEAVQLSRQASSKKGAGFINAVLRNVQRAIENRQSSLDAKHLQRIVPQTSEFGCLFSDDIFLTLRPMRWHISGPRFRCRNRLFRSGSKPLVRGKPGGFVLHLTVIHPLSCNPIRFAQWRRTWWKSFKKRAFLTNA